MKGTVHKYLDKNKIYFLLPKIASVIKYFV